MKARALPVTLFVLAAVGLSGACAPPLPAKAAPSCDANEEAVPASTAIGGADTDAKWTCEPRCELPKQRMTTFVGDLGGRRAYQFACIAPCPFGKQLVRTQKDQDTTTDYAYSCVDLPPAALSSPIVGNPTTREPDAKEEQDLSAQRFFQFRKEREQEAQALVQTCADPCASRAYACFRDPRSSGKTCVQMLHECEDSCHTRRQYY